MAVFDKEKLTSAFLNLTSKISKDDISDVLNNMNEILNKVTGSEHLNKLLEDIKLLFALISDYWKGNYKEVPWAVIASIVAALVYVLSPIDLIPDFIPIVGLIDDAFVISICLKAVSGELQKYSEWKKQQPL